MTTQTPEQAAFAALAARAQTALARLSLTPDESEPFGPYAVKILHDDSPEMPWRDCDGTTPLAWVSLGDGGINVETDGADPLDALGDVSPAWVSRHWRALAAALDLDAADHDRDAKETARDYGQGLGETRLDLFRDRLGEMRSDAEGFRSWGRAVDYLDALESVWKLRGVPVLSFQRNGYSQGDCVAGLLVAADAWREAMGIEPGRDMAEDLKAQADALGAWAFGDCYGFALEDRETGETLDSCFGFLGAYWRKDSPVLEAAAEAIASEDRARHRARLEAVKRFARNRVPLSVRARDLAALPAAWSDMTARDLDRLEARQ